VGGKPNSQSGEWFMYPGQRFENVTDYEAELILINKKTNEIIRYQSHHGSTDYFIDPISDHRTDHPDHHHGPRSAQATQITSRSRKQAQIMETTQIQIDTRYETEKLILKDSIQACHNKLNNIPEMDEQQKKAIKQRLNRYSQELGDLVSNKILADIQIKKTQNK
jgi:glutamate synthase domain-containing protein 2